MLVNEIGLDAGCAFIKTAWLEGGEWREASTPSLIRAGRANISMSGQQGQAYICSGEEWTVDANAVDAEDTRFNSYPYHAMNTVLSHHAIAQLQEPEETPGLYLHTELADEIFISCGLPIEHFYDLAGVNNNAISRKQDAMKLAVTGSPYTLTCRQICPEGLAGWVDVRIDRTGKNKYSQSNAVALGDIGGRTTDIAVIMPDYSLVPEYTGTINIGYLDVVSELNRLLTEKLKVGRINIMVLYQVIKTGVLPTPKQDHQVTDLVLQAVNTVSGKITREFERKVGNVPHLEGFCYLGGGADELRDSLTGDNTFIPERPGHSNARGNLKIMMHMGGE